MLNISDFKTDEADDIIITGDIEVEDDDLISVVKCGERRVSGRYDDFLLTNVGAGIERYLYDKITPGLKLQVIDEIRRSLSHNNLLPPGTYKVDVIEDDRKLSILLSLSSQFLDKTYSFKAVINQENQRSYN